MAINTVVLLGRLVADPILRKTATGLSVTSFTMAVDRQRASDGEPKTDFIDCVAWRGTGDFIAKYFTKGQMIGIEGSLRIGYREVNGEKQRRTEVVVAYVSFAGDSNKHGTRGEKSESSVMFEEIDTEDNELPF